MASLLALVLPFFGLILLGYLAARFTPLRHAGADGLAWLNAYVLYLALPALFFTLISRTPIEELARFDFIAVDLAATYAVFLLVFLLSRLVRGNGIAESTVQALAGCYGNIGYMGPGIALLALGEKAAVPVALIFSFENVAHFIAAPAMMALAGGETAHPLRLAGQVARRILLHPFILATLIGVGAAGLHLQPPAALDRLIAMLSPTAAPCALFAMGVTLGLRPLTRVPAEIFYIVPAKLLLHPILVGLALLLVGGFDPLWVEAAVLMAALPTAASVYVIAEQYQLWQQRASATILISTGLSVVTVSGLIYLLHAGILPTALR